MKKVFVYMVYEILQLRIFELLDNDVDMVTQDTIQEMALDIFQILEQMFFMMPGQIRICCTIWLGFSLREFVEAVMKSISEEDNSLFERVEQRTALSYE